MDEGGPIQLIIQGNSSHENYGRGLGQVGRGGPRYRHEAGDALDKEDHDHEWKGENTLGDHMQVA